MMRVLFKVSLVAVAALFLVAATAVAQPCLVNCPAGDGGPIGAPGAGIKSPDLNADTFVNIVDLSIFAGHWPPNPYDYCCDFFCDGVISLQDLAIFAAHWLHSGPVPGYCQPAIDHYKVYNAPGVWFPGPITLRDQFGERQIFELQLTKFATPVSKNGEMIFDEVAHQAWWEFRHPEPQRMIVVQDQFGTHEWLLGDAVYLLNPAFKNLDDPSLPLPELNHYDCYEAEGPPILLEVMLADQFDQVIVLVLEARYFCNPCEKITPDGMVYPIIDNDAHLTVYFVENPFPYNIQVRIRDQFVDEPLILFENQLLAVPAIKKEVIDPQDE